MNRSPLADRIRPTSLDDILGQQHLLGPGCPIKKQIESGHLFSMILFGPPGCGKTTIAQLLAKHFAADFISFSAATSGIVEIKKFMADADKRKKMYNRDTILFIDEIHRFNKAQQDAFLPYLEKGTIILIGATTENPSFELNSSLLSRTKVYMLNPLSNNDIVSIVKRALRSDNGLASKFKIPDMAVDFIANISDGDARVALNALELASLAAKDQSISLAIVEDVVQKKALKYDKQGEEHYNIISALHKSMRGSDPDAALYWLARMLEAGEDPMYIARRLVRFSVEDIGSADPNALVIAIAARDAIEFIGRPEGDLALAHCVVYLARAAKSNEIYVAYDKAREDALKTNAEPVPMHIRNAPTKLMTELGYGKGYKYDHDYPNAKAPQEYFPDSLKDRKYLRKKVKKDE
ncbi:AAA family ATPase [candidate division WOR-3 bacterium RBG_13_43_14]|uniref:Replication-associated recombination protein A n=1 Tax=candidate division WOR-3 bacterium RBG_13_43_14 TaxID=1802590 RepID=A0A1F4UEX4_UNCW3|nr:MAG: AAA family ATPase [candidate division WOR-3 bacterium RBG_13_43_14]